MSTSNKPISSNSAVLQAVRALESKVATNNNSHNVVTPISSEKINAIKKKLLEQPSSVATRKEHGVASEEQKPSYGSSNNITNTSKQQPQPSEKKACSDDELSQKSNNSAKPSSSPKKNRRKSLLERLHLTGSSRRNAQSQPPPVTRKTTTKKTKNATSSFSNKPIIAASATAKTTTPITTTTTNVAAAAGTAAAAAPAIVTPTSSSTTSPVAAAAATEEVNTSTTSSNNSRRGRSFSRRRNNQPKKQKEKRRRTGGSVSNVASTSTDAEAARSTSRSRWFRRSLSNQRSNHQEVNQAEPQEPVVVPSSAASDSADHDKPVAPSLPTTVSSASLQRSTETLVRSLIYSPTEHVTEHSVQRALKEWNRMQQELTALRTTATATTTADHSGIVGSAAAAAVSNKLPLILLETKNKQLQLELTAAQKAAAQLEEQNQQHEEQQQQTRRELTAVQAQIEHYRDSKTSSSQVLQWQKQVSLLQDQVEQLEQEKAKLEKQQQLDADNRSNNNIRGRGRMPTRRPIPTAANSPGGGGGGDCCNTSRSSITNNNNPMEESFEIQLSMQKNVAHLTAKVQRLAAESANFQRELKLKSEQYEKLREEHNAAIGTAATNLRLLEQQQTQQTVVDQPSVVSSTGIVSVGSVGDCDDVDRSPQQRRHRHRDDEEWQSLLKKMQQKNQNQKKVFETAMEIKDVELQIYQKERDVAVEKTAELQQQVEELEPLVAELQLSQVAVLQLREELEQERLQAQCKNNNESSSSSSSTLLAAQAVAQETAERLNMRIHDLEQDLQKGEERIVMLQSELEEKEQLLEFQSNETLELLTEERSRLDEVTADLYAKEMEMQELKDQQEQSGRLKQSVADLERQVGEHQENAQLHEEQIHELQRELESQRRLADKATRRVQKEAAKMVESRLQQAGQALKTCKEESDHTIASLQQHVTDLESELARTKEHQKELEELLQMAHEEAQEQVRLAEEKAKRLLEQKGESKEEKREIQQLRQQLDESERKLEQALREIGMASAASRQATAPPNQQGSSRLAELRQKMGTYEHLMRAKVKRIHEMETQDSRSASPNTACSSLAQEDLASFPLVVATLLPNTTSPPVAATEAARFREQQEAVRARDEKIFQLQNALQEAQGRLAAAETQHPFMARNNRENGPSDVEELHEDRRVEMDIALHDASDDRVAQLKAQLVQAQQRLVQVQQHVQAQAAEDRERQVEEVQQTSNVRLTQLREIQDQLSAVQVELEQECSRHRETQHAYEMLARQVEDLEEERENTVGQLQEAEVELLGLQLKYEEMESALTKSSVQLKEAISLMAQSDSSTGNDRLSELENKLKRKNALLRKADKKIEMLEQFIQQEKQVVANDHQGEIERLEALVKEKEGEVNAVRAEAEELRAQIDCMRNRVEQLEEERNYNRAKLSELSGILQVRGKNQADIQLYNKCIECADLTADKDSLKCKLRAAQATAQRLEQEVSLTRELVQNMSQSWDGALSSDENIVRLKREQEQSLTKATELSIQLAESQMQIDEIRERLNNAEKANRSYAEQLARSNQGRTNFQDRIVELIHGDTTGTSGGNCTSDNNNNDEAMRRMKQRIELLEDENAAYVASLSAVKSELEMRQEGSS